jgi:hypothetical protein
VSVSRPAAPTNLTVKPGDGRLMLDWDAGDGGASAVEYWVVVRRAGTVEKRQPSSGTSVTISGLQNETTYDVSVYALSAGENASLTPATGSGMPQEVDDFWDVYEGAGGGEQGGCGAGGAGVAGLLAAAAALLTTRRRKP